VFTFKKIAEIRRGKQDFFVDDSHFLGLRLPVYQIERRSSYQ
jgi:hypothetical protein